MKGEKLDGNLEKGFDMLRKDNQPQRALILKRLKEEIVLLIIQKGVVKHILWLVCNSRR